MPPPTLLIAGNLQSNKKAIPIEYIIDWIKKRTQFQSKSHLDDRVLIIKSETGSGKSTVLPVYLFRIYRSSTLPSDIGFEGRSVLCCQPRVLTAIKLAEGISEAEYYPDLALPTNVGYQTGPLTNRPKNGLIYLTNGILLSYLRIMTDEDFINSFSVIIIDEAHERSIELDTTIMKLKYFYLRNIDNPKLPFLILASATLNTLQFSDYFKISTSNIITVTGRSFPITTHWCKENIHNFIESSAKTAAEIHLKYKDDPENERDILIFMPGKSEIDQCCANLRQLNTKDYPMLILPITGESVALNTEDFQCINGPYNHRKVIISDNKYTPKRRVVVATVVAETGLTIESLKYVIDPGWSREKEYYFPDYSTILITRPATQSRIKQRMGRVGRLFPGEFYPLYSEDTFNSAAKQQYPNIINEGPLEVMLDIIIEQHKYKKTNKAQDVEFRIEDIDLLDAPSPDSLAKSLYILFEWNFVSFIEDLGNTRGYMVTQLGMMANKFNRVPLFGVKLLLTFDTEQINMLDAATIIALITKCDRGLQDLYKGEEFHKANPAMKLINDELLTGLLMFNQFCDKASKADSWCRKMGIKKGKMIQIVAEREVIIQESIHAGYNPFYYQANALCRSWEYIFKYKKCIYDTFKYNLKINDSGKFTYVNSFYMSTTQLQWYGKKSFTKLLLLSPSQDEA